MRWRPIFALLFILANWVSVAPAQGIIVDHTSLPLFDQIPNEYFTAAADLPMMFVDRSVGSNINDGLTCLQFASDSVAPASCKRFEHVASQFSSPQSQVTWSRPGGYSRAKWNYFGWPGTGIPPELPCGVAAVDYWHKQVECFIRYVAANPVKYTVYSFQFSYLDVDTSSDINSPATGFFARQSNRYDVDDFEEMARRYPWLLFIHHTTSLARSIGTRVSTEFNDQLRAYVRENNQVLLDVADIESHDPAGQPCYDNRDGVPYAGGGAIENYPDDGLDLPAICQGYTRESNGGHLGNPDVGKIRLAKAFWIVMARLAGWHPPSQPSDEVVPNRPR